MWSVTLNWEDFADELNWEAMPPADRSDFSHRKDCDAAGPATRNLRIHRPMYCSSKA